MKKSKRVLPLAPPGKEWDCISYTRILEILIDLRPHNREIKFVVHTANAKKEEKAIKEMTKRTEHKISVTDRKYLAGKKDSLPSRHWQFIRINSLVMRMLFRGVPKGTLFADQGAQRYSIVRKTTRIRYFLTDSACVSEETEPELSTQLAA